MSKYGFFTKNGFVLSAELFPVLTNEFKIPFVRQGVTKNPMAVIQKRSAFLLENSYSLIGCNTAIDLSLDNIQTRPLVHPRKPNHYVYISFFLYFFS